MAYGEQIFDTQLYGATGHGATGHGATGTSHIYIANGQSNVIRAGYENKEQNEKEINKRFYERLDQLFENEEESKTKSKHFLNMNTQLDKDPNDYLQIGDYYDYIISHFYMNDHTSETHLGELWLRQKTKFYQINLTEKSGSIYQSPYDYNQGFIYIGISDTDGMCICGEKDKTFSFLSPYYFSRSSLIHDVKNSVMDTRIKVFIKRRHLSSIKVSERTRSEGDVGKLILEGKLSDDEIKCTDGIVNVSKSILSLYSNYFLYLFTNDKFKKQESYKIDFPKKILEYYILYCCSSENVFDPELTIDMISFGDFIQDKKFLQKYYSEIYNHRESFTNKSLLEIIKIYKNLID